MTINKRYFLVNESIMYKGHVHAKGSMIVELDRDDDILFQNLLGIASDNPFDSDAMIVEIEKKDVPKVVKAPAFKKQIFVEQGSSPELFAEIQQIMSVAMEAAPVAPEVDTAPVDDEIETSSEISEPLADEPTEADVVPEDEPEDEEDEEIILPIKRKKHR